jgi:hypothetical protein
VYSVGYSVLATVGNFFWLQHKRAEETLEMSEFGCYNITSKYTM